MIIGITGPIASGKDIFINILSEKLYENSTKLQFTNQLTIDADKFGKFLVENNLNKIMKTFNTKSLSELSELVFSDFDSLLKYNNFIHPILSARLRKILLKIKIDEKQNEQIFYQKTDTQRLNTLRKDNQHLSNNIILLNCALLYLFKLDFYCDKIIFIDANKDIRLERLIKRNNLSYDIAEKRIVFQEKIENYEKIREIAKQQKLYLNDFSMISYDKKLIYYNNNSDLNKITEFSNGISKLLKGID